jgi:putative hydrolase of the HAD superfamily
MSIDRRYVAISFDVGYTLIQPLGEAPAIVGGLLAELGVAADDDALAAAHQRAERLFLSDYFRPLNDTWEADERINRLYLRYYGQWLAELGVADPETRYAQTIIDRYLDPSNWRLYPHALETLATLHQQGYRLGIASDWVSGLPRILHSLGLSRYLDWALVSGAIGFAKPSPQFYRLVLARAGARPEQIVHVGDSYYADVRGARTVGMDAILLDWRRRSWPRLDVPLIYDLAELPTLLAAHTADRP